MDNESLLFLLTGSLSGPPANTTSNPTSFRPQGMSVLDGRWPDTLNIPDSQVVVEAYGDNNLRSSLHLPAFADADTNPNCRQVGMSMNAPSSLDRSLQCPAIHTPDFSVTSTLPDNNMNSQLIVAQHQEKTLMEIFQQTQLLGNGPTAVSSRFPRKPMKVRYMCRICRRDFAQDRGVRRHCRDVHEFSLCLHCNGFQWHRRPELEEHLKKEHPNIGLRAALTEATSYRRRDTMIRNSSREQQAIPYTIEYGERDEHLPQPWTPPSPPALEATHVSFPAAVSSVAYGPQYGPTFTNLRRRREYVRKAMPHYQML